MRVSWRWFLGLIWVGVSATRAGSPVFSDEIPFKIRWPGADFTLATSGGLYKEDDYVIMTTAEKEKYKCLLPSLSSNQEDDMKEYSGPSPAELLEPLFKQSSCSYRIESYWTYEVCHGKHVRQYHEDKETGQKINIQEYYLGTMKKKDIRKCMSPEDFLKLSVCSQVPTKNIEGQLTPYYPVEMGHGTQCSLRQNKPRFTTVLYVCHPEAKHEILTIAEVITCQYEVVVLTPLLCPHPKYRFKSSPVNDIFCQALGGSPLRPQSLSQLDREQEELLKPSFSSSSERDQRGSRGVGWWKYEFCYGKHVHQYHEDKEQGKNIVVVGSWNTEDHINWAKKNVARSYHLKDDGAQKVKVVSHFYGHGDVCDLTGKPRQVIVKLKCKESESPHAVTVYMLEPQTCQYVLGVESPVICKILDTADENGFLSIPS
uniref:Endoplasmic reticulum lectin n=1 Tax=Cyprinus carpio carpio TaxID=630221 RepID=A0A8C1A9Q4_CYPCA